MERLQPIISGFIFNCLTIFILSLLGKAPSKAITDRFNQAEAAYRHYPKFVLIASTNVFTLIVDRLTEGTMTYTGRTGPS